MLKYNVTVQIIVSITGIPYNDGYDLHIQAHSEEEALEKAKKHMSADEAIHNGPDMYRIIKVTCLGDVDLNGIDVPAGWLFEFEEEE